MDGGSTGSLTREWTASTVVPPASEERPCSAPTTLPHPAPPLLPGAAEGSSDSLGRRSPARSGRLLSRAAHSFADLLHGELGPIVLRDEDAADVLSDGSDSHQLDSP